MKVVNVQFPCASSEFGEYLEEYSTVNLFKKQTDHWKSSELARAEIWENTQEKECVCLLCSFPSADGNSWPICQAADLHETLGLNSYGHSFVLVSRYPPSSEITCESLASPQVTASEPLGASQPFSLARDEE